MIPATVGALEITTLIVSPKPRNAHRRRLKGLHTLGFVYDERRYGLATLTQYAVAVYATGVYANAQMHFFGFGSGSPPDTRQPGQMMCLLPSLPSLPDLPELPSLLAKCEAIEATSTPEHEHEPEVGCTVTEWSALLTPAV